jgi:glycosyltransferase involved in cell wall biosynthesis
VSVKGTKQTMSANEGQVTETSLPDDQRWLMSGSAGKKILFVTRTYEYGGAEKDLVELIRRLREPGLEVSILCLGYDFFSERLLEQGVRVMTCKRAPKALWGWVHLFRVTQPDVVVLVYGWIWSFPWIASVGAWLAGIPRRFSIQQLIIPANAKRGPLRRALRTMLGPVNWRIAAHLFHTTICVSDAMRDSLVKDLGFPAAKMKMIHNGVSLSQFAPSERNGAGIRNKLRLGPEEFILVCVARLSQQKGIDILLQAMARVLLVGVACKCVIVGDGPLRELLFEQARQLDLSGHVFFEGFQEDVRPYLQAASAFILTSHSEGLPLSIVEAMACGLPSIVTDVGGNAEAITHRVHGLVVAPGSVGGIADAIVYLATHPTERAQMARMARARAWEAFDIENRMTEIKRVILN